MHEKISLYIWVFNISDQLVLHQLMGIDEYLCFFHKVSVAIFHVFCPNVEFR